MWHKSYILIMYKMHGKKFKYNVIILGQIYADNASCITMRKDYSSIVFKFVNKNDHVYYIKQQLKQIFEGCEDLFNLL